MNPLKILVVGVFLLQITGVVRGAPKIKRWIPDRMSDNDYGLETTHSYQVGDTTDGQPNYMSYWDYVPGGGYTPGDYSGMFYRAGGGSKPDTQSVPMDPVQQLQNVQRYAYYQNANPYLYPPQAYYPPPQVYGYPQGDPGPTGRSLLHLGALNQQSQFAQPNTFVLTQPQPQKQFFVVNNGQSLTPNLLSEISQQQQLAFMAAPQIMQFPQTVSSFQEVSQVSPQTSSQASPQESSQVSPQEAIQVSPQASSQASPQGSSQVSDVSTASVNEAEASQSATLEKIAEALAASKLPEVQSSSTSSHQQTHENIKLISAHNDKTSQRAKEAVASVDENVNSQTSSASSLINKMNQRQQINQDNGQQKSMKELEAMLESEIEALGARAKVEDVIEEDVIAAAVAEEVVITDDSQDANVEDIVQEEVVVIAEDIVDEETTAEKGKKAEGRAYSGSAPDPYNASPLDKIYPGVMQPTPYRPSVTYPASYQQQPQYPVQTTTPTGYPYQAYQQQQQRPQQYYYPSPYTTPAQSPYSSPVPYQGYGVQQPAQYSTSSGYYSPPRVARDSASLETSPMVVGYVVGGRYYPKFG